MTRRRKHSESFKREAVTLAKRGSGATTSRMRRASGFDAPSGRETSRQHDVPSHRHGYRWVRYRPSPRRPIAKSRRDRRSVLVDCERGYGTSCAAGLRDGEAHEAAGAGSDNTGRVEIARSA